MDTESPHFFVDVTGDPALLDTDTHSAPRGTSTAADFIPLATHRTNNNTNNNNNHNSNSNSYHKGSKAKGKKNTKVRMTKKEREDEEYALMLDYMANCDEIESEAMAQGPFRNLMQLSIDNAMVDHDSQDDFQFSDGFTNSDTTDAEDSFEDTSDDFTDASNDDSVLDAEIGFAGQVYEDEEAYIRSGYGKLDLVEELNKIASKKPNKSGKGNYRFSESDFEDFLDTSGCFDDGPVTRSGTKKKAAFDKKKSRDKKREAASDRDLVTRDLAKSVHSSTAKSNDGIHKFLVVCNEKIHDFLADPYAGESFILPRMPSSVKLVVKQISGAYGVNLKVRGKAQHKIFVIIRKQGSTIPKNWKGLPDRLMASTNSKQLQGKSKKQLNDPDAAKKARTKKQPQIARSSADPKMGDVVGMKAKPLGVENAGHKMLLAMGWKPGQPLGDPMSNGIIEPITATIRSKRGGLGGE